MVEKISIPHATHKILDVADLRDTEQGVLNYMLLSNSNFVEIRDTLSEGDFTFLIHKVIFRYLVYLDELFLSEKYQGANALNTQIEVFAETLNEHEDVKIVSILDILSQTPSMHIKRDLEILNANSMEKEIAIYSNEVQRRGSIETKDGLTWFTFIKNVLISVGTSNISQLPIELHNNFDDTFGSLSDLDLQNGENKVTMTLYGDTDNSDGIESFYLKKDLVELKWVDDICKWADKHELDEDIFPRNRFKLEGLIKLDITNKGIDELPKEIEQLSSLEILTIDENKIKEFPIELYQLKNLRMLSCMKNEISYVSEEIINLQELVVFAACHNAISSLPNNFFRLKSLKSICLHDNKLTTLSSDIGNLSSLRSITISNNDISLLPQSFSKLESVESLDIENTQLTEIPIDFLKHRSLQRLSINDDLLALVIQNMQYLDIDTINLTASYLEEDSKIIQELDFKVDTESWVEDRDKKDNGCVQLSKYINKEDE